MYSYFNGTIVPLKNVSVDPYDLGFLRGYGVFDFMRTANGKPFLIREHFIRLECSAKSLGLKLPFGESEYEKIIDRLLKLNGFKESTVRTVVTGGISSDAFSIGKETILVLVEKFKPLPRAVYRKGAKVITLDYRRLNPRVKVTNYIEAIRNQSRKRKAGALEIIYVHKGKVFESSTSNVFIVKKKQVITPKEGVLFGITRYAVMKLAKKNGLGIAERSVSEKELYSADEVFLTATNKGVVPVISVDGEKIGNGKPGEVTKLLMKLLDDFMRAR